MIVDIYVAVKDSSIIGISLLYIFEDLKMLDVIDLKELRV